MRPHLQTCCRHIEALDYKGPVALSCDDTKLFATYRLYWDKEQDSYVLIGGTDGPLVVMDPDSVQEVIDQAKAQKATKVRVSLRILLFDDFEGMLFYSSF